MHPVVLEGKLRRSQWGGTRGDQNLFAENELLRTIFASDPDRVRVDETRRSVKLGHAAQRQPGLDPLSLAAGHAFLVPHEISDGGLAPEREIHAKEFARAPARKHQRGL